MANRSETSPAGRRERVDLLSEGLDPRRVKDLVTLAFTGIHRRNTNAERTCSWTIPTDKIVDEVGAVILARSSRRRSTHSLSR